MSTPHEVARDLRERMESAKRAASNPEAGSVYAFEYLLSACEAACARLDLQAGSGEQRHRPGSAGENAAPAPAAGEGTTRCPLPAGDVFHGWCKRKWCRQPALKDAEFCNAHLLDCTVSDAEAEAAADSLCGSPVESATSRVFVGKGPERLAKRFPIMGGRRG